MGERLIRTHCMVIGERKCSQQRVCTDKLVQIYTLAVYTLGLRGPSLSPAMASGCFKPISCSSARAACSLKLPVPAVTGGGGGMLGAVVFHDGHCAPGTDVGHGCAAPWR